MTEPIDERLLCRCCGQVHAGARLVTLPDGQIIGNYSEEHRAYHEAMTVIKMSTKLDRQRYLAGVEQKRGLQSANQLRDDIVYWWDYRATPKPEVGSK